MTAAHLSLAPESAVIVALDGLSEAQSLALAAKLTGKVWGFKVNDLLVEHGISIVEKLKRYGRVFADPKLHDIPNTVRHAVARLSGAGADMITLHASGGLSMLQAATETAGGSALLAVTVLTSLDDSEARSVYDCGTHDAVRRLAGLAAASGVAGVVCSSRELPLLAMEPRLAGLLRVVPGIRPEGYDRIDDQQRTATPHAALRAGATHLVIGRPITAAADPLAALQRLGVESLQESTGP